MSAEPVVETVAGRILRQLGEAGVEVVFGLPGVHNLAFWAAHGPGLPRIVGVRHEQSAVYAADGHARESGRLGVALVTSGPGAANAVGAFGEAHASASPVLLLASEPPLTGRRTTGYDTGMLHAMPDQAAMFGPPFDAFAMSLRSPVEASHLIPAIARTLLRLPAPGYVGIPADVLRAPADATTTSLPDLWDRRPDLAPAVPEPADVTALARLLSGRRTVLWVGAEVIADGHDTIVTELAHRLRAPIVTSIEARGAFADTGLAIDAPPHEPEVEALIAAADVLFVLGDPLHAMSTRGWTMRLPPNIAVVTRHAGRSLGDYPLAHLSETDIGVTVAALLMQLAEHPAWAPRGLDSRVRHRLASDPRTAEAMSVLDAVEDFWPAEGAVVTDMCIPGYWLANYARQPRRRRMQHPLGWGTLGFGLPAAIGPAAHGVATLAVVGDGGAAMGVGELASMAAEGLPIALLVIDDGGYGMLRYDQGAAHETHRGVDLLGPHWPTLARAYGMAVIEVDGVASLPAALQDAAHRVGSGPVLLHLRAALFPPRTSSPRWRDPAPPI